MKLVADIDTIIGNLTSLAGSIETYTSSCSSFSSGSVDCTVSEITSVLESYKSTISNDLSKLSTSSTEYQTLVDECCTSYQQNEANTKSIDASNVINIIANNTEITTEYEGGAATALTGLTSTKLYDTVYYDPNLTYNEGGMAIPIFYQGDYGYVALGSSNVASSGCGFTSCAMVASYLTKSTITPEDLASWSQGYYVEGAGMSWALPAAVAEHYDLGTVTQTTSISEVKEALAEGKPVMSSQSAGIFTSGGHLIVLRGLDDNGNILVNDPNSANSVGKDYNNTSFTDEEIDQANKQYFIFNAENFN